MKPPQNHSKTKTVPQKSPQNFATPNRTIKNHHPTTGCKSRRAAPTGLQSSPPHLVEMSLQLLKGFLLCWPSLCIAATHPRTRKEALQKQLSWSEELIIDLLKLYVILFQMLMFGLCFLKGFMKKWIGVLVVGWAQPSSSHGHGFWLVFGAKAKSTLSQGKGNGRFELFQKIGKTPPQKKKKWNNPPLFCHS